MAEKASSVVRKQSVEVLSPGETLCDPLETWPAKIPASEFSPQASICPPIVYSLEFSHLPARAHAEPTKWQRVRASDCTLVAVCAYCIFYQIFACTLYTPVMQYRLKDIGVENVEATTGYLSSVWAAGCLVASPAAGWLPSVYPNKRYHLLGYTGILMAASLLFAMVPSVGGLMAGRLFHGFGASGLWTVALALLSENVNPQIAGRMTGITQVGFAFGNAVSPTLGGTIYNSMGWKPLCFFALGMGVINILLVTLYIEKVQLLNMTISNIKSTSEVASNHDTLRLPWATLLRTLFLDSRYVVSAAVSLCWGAWSNGITYTAMPLRLEERYGLDSARVGYTFLAIAGASIVCSPLAGYMTDRVGARPLLLSCLISFIIWAGLLCIDQLPYICFVLLLVGVGISSSFITTPILVYLSIVDRVNKHRVGSSIICGLFCTANSLASLVMPFIAGALLQGLDESLGWIAVLSVQGVFLVAYLLAVFRYMRVPTAVSVPATSESPAKAEKCVV